MSAWGPAFYLPGSGGTPQSGTSTSTNTGTLNFSATPNNGTDYAFKHNFSSVSALAAAYPTGFYGVKFLGSGAPNPAQFTAGLEYAAGTYPSVTPQITSVDNGAVWAGGLKIKGTGVTTLTLNSFPEYGSTTYGSIMGAGIYDVSGNVVGSASLQSHYLPTYNPVVNESPITQLTIDGSWLTPGVRYTIELQYSVIATPPATGALTTSPGHDETFQGLATYNKNTTISIWVESPDNSDFNQDGQNDILFKNSATCQIGIWTMTGTTPTGWVVLPNVSTDWQIKTVADFNGDSQPDIVFENSATAQVGIRLMNGTTPGAWVDLPTVTTAWQIKAAADFNGDGQPDIVFENSATAQIGVWIMNGTTPVNWIVLPTVTTAWQIKAAADFNGDGKPDILFENSSTAQVGVWIMNGTTPINWVVLPTVTTAWQIQGAKDFDGDGQPDILFENSATAQIGVWIMNGTTPVNWAVLPTVTTDWQIVNH